MDAPATPIGRMFPDESLRTWFCELVRLGITESVARELIERHSHEVAPLADPVAALYHRYLIEKE